MMNNGIVLLYSNYILESYRWVLFNLLKEKEFEKLLIKSWHELFKKHNCDLFGGDIFICGKELIHKLPPIPNLYSEQIRIDDSLLNPNQGYFMKNPNLIKETITKDVYNKSSIFSHVRKFLKLKLKL